MICIVDNPCANWSSQKDSIFCLFVCKPDSHKTLYQWVELLEEHDDVNDVFANFDIPDELLEALM